MIEYSKRLGALSPEQFQQALQRFELGDFLEAQAIPFGEFGQNVFLTSTQGQYVLRGAPLLSEQFATEQFFVDLLHERTGVAVPWPYRIDEATDIFGWSYVIMPRMPGLQLSNPEVSGSLSFEERSKVAQAMGKNLAAMQTLTWPYSGHYDFSRRTIKPLGQPYSSWVLERLYQNLQKAMQYNDRTDETDVLWIEQLIAPAQAFLDEDFQPCFVDHDYKEGNIVVTPTDGEWFVSGIFDLMGAHFGDGEAGLSRLLFVYINEDERLAEAFVQAYIEQTALRPGFKERYVLYMLDNCIILWEYFQKTQPDWLDKRWRFRDWMSRYIAPSFLTAL